MSKYDQALAALKSLVVTDAVDEPEGFAALMVAACERAAGWNADEDPYEARREEDRIWIRNGVSSLAKATKRLRDLSTEYEQGFEAVAWRAVKATGITPDMMSAAGYESADRGQGARFARALLGALAAQLDAEGHRDSRSIKGASTGGIHRHIHGPLNYPAIVDTSRMPNPRITGLQFELVFHLRRYTGARPAREIRIDDALPTCGRVFFGVVDEFTGAALNHWPADDGAAFTKAMRSNAAESKTPVRWWGWSSPEGTKDAFGPVAYWGDDD